MIGWLHQSNGHEFQQTPGESEGQGSLAFCHSWGCKELDMTEQLNNNNTEARKKKIIPMAKFYFLIYTQWILMKLLINAIEMRNEPKVFFFLKIISNHSFNPL